MVKGMNRVYLTLMCFLLLLGCAARQPDLLQNNTSSIHLSQTNQEKTYETIQAQKSDEKIMVSIFGIPLGGHINIPECPKKPGVETNILIAMASNNTLCFHRFNGEQSRNGPPINELVYLVFPNNDRPKLGTIYTAFFINGSIQQIGFGMLGIRHQDVYLHELKNKFGEPTEFLEREVTTLAGGRLNTFIATWIMDGYKVVFNPVIDDLNYGTVEISTEIGEKAEEERLRKIIEKRNGREL